MNGREVRLAAPTARRARATGYGSRLLTEVSGVLPRYVAIEGAGVRALARRIWTALPWLLLYRLLLPSVEVPIGTGEESAMLAQQLRHREGGRLKFRHAQGVLFLPERFSDYTRGRHRQAVRTNVRRARERGFVVSCQRISNWRLEPNDARFRSVTASSAVERWSARDENGHEVASACITIHGRVALLHFAVSDAADARWLVHSEIVQRLCGTCELLITNTADVPLMPAGLRHYQRLLGYSVVRLRIRRSREEILRKPALRVGALCSAATAVIVANVTLPTAPPPFDERVLVWLTALVAVRRLSSRAGPASVTAAVAGLTILALHGLHRPDDAVAWFTAGISMDLLLALVPRLTWGSVSVAPAGVTAALAALLVSGVSRVGTEGWVDGHATSLWGAAVACGAVAAAAGWWLGGRLNPLVRPQT